MQETILANHFSRLSACLLSMLLLTSFTIGPVYADLAFKDNNRDVIHEIRIHMETLGLEDAEIAEKLTQLKEKVSAGMPFKDLCTHCHTNKMKQERKP